MMRYFVDVGKAMVNALPLGESPARLRMSPGDLTRHGESVT